MDSQRAPTGALVITVGKEGQPHWEGKWRWQGKQCKRRLGRAWLEPANGYSGKRRATRWPDWIRRTGSVPAGYLDEHAATRAMRAKIKHEIEREHSRAQQREVISFEQAARAWIHDGKRVKGWKGSTARDYEALLRDEDDRPAKRGRRPRARIMRRFGGRPIEAISEGEIRAFLQELDRSEISARSVNKHRAVLSAIFGHAIEHGWRESNPVERVPKRRQADPGELIVLSPEQVAAVAREAQTEQDLALIIVAAFSGLRMGELLALRWRDVRFSEQAIIVARAYTAGVGVSSPKSRKARSVPLADQPAAVLAKLGQREEFSGPDDLVFCTDSGQHLDPGVVRRRYKRALAKAQKRDRTIPTARFHDLRHAFGSQLASAGIPIRDIQEFMGHRDAATTAIYVHHVPKEDAARRLTAAFASEQIEEIEPEEEPEAA
jgi:integrase